MPDINKELGENVRPRAKYNEITIDAPLERRKHTLPAFHKVMKKYLIQATQELGLDLIGLNQLS